MTATPPHYLICRTCSHSILVEQGLDHDIECVNCGQTNHKMKANSAAKTLAYSLTALIFYIPAMLLPFMTIELYGNRNSSTIWSGIVSLADAGSWFIAVVVFLASILIPFLKIAVLFYLSAAIRAKNHSWFNTKLYEAVEAIGRWSMLDIFLLAVLVAIMKLGHWTTVEPEIGALMFLLVVIFTMLASASFDPRLLWKEENGKDDSTN